MSNVAYAVPLNAGAMAGGFRYGSHGHYEAPNPAHDHTKSYIAQASSGGKLWKGQALSKSNNPWSHLYGISGKKIGQDPEKSFEEEIRDLPDYYDGTSSPLLGKILISQMTATRSFWLDEICPLRRTDTTHTSIKEWLFKDEYLGQVPEEGVCRLVRNNQSERTATVSRKGLGFTNEHMFLGTPMGEQGFWMQMEQVNNACVDTASHEIATKIYLESEEASMYRTGGPGGITYQQYEDTVKANLGMWGVLQRYEDGFKVAVSKARETMKSRCGQPGNLVIIPAGAEFATWEANVTAGLNLIRGKGITTNEKWWKSGADKMVMRESRAFRTYADAEDDPAYSNRLTGDYVTMTMYNYHDCPAKDFSLGKCMSIEWWSEQADDFELLSFKNTIRYTGACPGWDDLPSNCNFSQDNNVWINNPFRGNEDASMHQMGNDDLGFHSDYMDQGVQGGRNVTNKQRYVSWGAETAYGFPGEQDGADNDHTRLQALLRNNPKKKYAPWMYEWFEKEGWKSLGDCYHKQGLLQLLVDCINKMDDNNYLDLFYKYLYPDETVVKLANIHKATQEIDDDEDVVETSAPAPLSSYRGNDKEVKTQSTGATPAEQLFNVTDTDMTAADIVKIDQLVLRLIDKYEKEIVNYKHNKRKLRSVTADNKSAITAIFKLAGSARTKDFWDPILDDDERKRKPIADDKNARVKLITNMVRILEVANITSSVDYTTTTREMLYNLYVHLNEVVPLNQNDGQYDELITAILTDAAKPHTDEKIEEMAIDSNVTSYLYKEYEQKNTHKAHRRSRREIDSKNTAANTLGFKVVTDYKTNNQFVKTLHPLDIISEIVDKQGGGKGIKHLSDERLKQVLIERLSFTSYEPFKWIVDHGLPPCFGILSFRPNQEWEMGSICLTMGGGEVGNMLYMMPDFQIQNDSIRKIMIANFTVYLGCLITDPKKIVIIPDVYCKKYIGGWGTEAWDASDPDHIEQQTRDPTQRDVYHCIVNAMFHYKGYWMHLNGRQPKEVRDRRPGTSEYSYPTAEYYTNHVWLNWKNDESNLLTQAYPNQTNSLCFQGYQGNYNMRNPDRPIIKPNKGPWGDSLYPGSAATRSGGTRRLLPVDYKRVSLMAMAA